VWHIADKFNLDLGYIIRLGILGFMPRKIEARPQATLVVVHIKIVCGPSFCAGSGPILSLLDHTEI